MFLKSIFVFACAASPVFSAWDQVWYAHENFHVAPANTPFSSLDHGVNFYFQYDGNFVAYLHGTVNAADAAWSSQTAGADCTKISCQLIFQTDGNLVIYQNGVAVWQTGTLPRGDQLVVSTAHPYVKVQDHQGYDLWTATRECLGVECVPTPP